MLNTTAIGHLGQDATVNQTNGKTVINFSIAHTEKYKDAAGTAHEKTTWVTCSMWDRPALAPYLKKGTQVFVSGTPTVQAYASKQTGALMAEFRLTVGRLELLGSKPATPAPAPTAAPPTHVAANTEPVGVSDDFPF